MAVNQQDEWATEEEWVDEPIEESVEEPGMVGRAWDALNKPLVDLSPVANRAADYVDTPELDDTGWGARLKGFGAGAIQGLGDVVSSLTSPLELGLAAASGGSSLAAKRGLSGVARGLAAAEGGLGLLESGHGVGEIYGGAKEGNLARVGMGIVEAAGGGAGMKQGFDGFTAKPKPTAPTPEPTPEPVAKVAEPTPDTEWIDIDSTVDGMVDEALAEPRRPNQELIPEPVAETVIPEAVTPEPVVAAPAVKEKPKIKVRINRETNSLEPDLSDELTAKVFKSALTGEPVPNGQRINPDEEIDFSEALAMANARQPELGARIPDNPVKATSEAGDLTGAKQPEMKEVRVNDSILPDDGKPLNRVEAARQTILKQSELPGNLRQPKPDTFVPGGRPAPIVPGPTGIKAVFGLAKAINSSYDLSAPLRQGLGLIHTKGWWKAWPDMFKALGSEKSYDALMDSINARPNFRGREVTARNGKKVIEQSFAQKAGLSMTDMNSQREEAFVSKIADKIPGVKASGRAYNAFLNKVRADTFDALIAANPHAKTDMVLAKEFASFVNNASGRGDLGSWEASGRKLNEYMFSPKLMASRLQMLNPKNYIYTRPEVRQQYLHSMLATAATWGSLAGLAKAGGAEVVMDPESSDFGKIKIGDTRLDPAGGFQQYLVLAHRLSKGGFDKVFRGTGRYKKDIFTSGGNDLAQFIENKLAPSARFVTGMYGASKNRPFELADQTLRSFTPIMLQDISEILQKNPDLAWVLIPGAFGMGSNTYNSKDQDTTLIPPSMGWNRNKDFTVR